MGFSAQVSGCRMAFGRGHVIALLSVIVIFSYSPVECAGRFRRLNRSLAMYEPLLRDPEAIYRLLQLIRRLSKIIPKDHAGTGTARPRDGRVPAAAPTTGTTTVRVGTDQVQIPAPTTRPGAGVTGPVTGGTAGGVIGPVTGGKRKSCPYADLSKCIERKRHPLPHLPKTPDSSFPRLPDRTATGQRPLTTTDLQNFNNRGSRRAQQKGQSAVKTLQG